MCLGLLCCFMALFFLTGCAALGKQGGQPESQQPDISFDLENVGQEDLEAYVQKKGIVFAKTDFQGVLQATYVKLLFEGQGGNKEKFYLHIEDTSSGKETFPWDIKAVKPGYFFIELPAGQYKISSIAIPVGTTLAAEDMNIGFEVMAGEVVYMGTLKVVGTKETIKLGGVPVIKPGFEYVAEILDEQQEGVAAFRQRYPNFSADITTQLMHVN